MRVKAKYGRCLEIEATDFGVVQTLIGRDLPRFTCASGSHRGKSGISCTAGSRNAFEKMVLSFKSLKLWHHQVVEHEHKGLRRKEGANWGN